MADSEDELWVMDDEVDTTGLGGDEADSTRETASAAPRPRRKGRKALRGIFSRIKGVVILSIMMQSRVQQCNALQSVVGIFLHASNTPVKASTLPDVEAAGALSWAPTVLGAPPSRSEQPEGNTYDDLFIESLLPPAGSLSRTVFEAWDESGPCCCRFVGTLSAQMLLEHSPQDPALNRYSEKLSGPAAGIEVIPVVKLHQAGIGDLKRLDSVSPVPGDPVEDLDEFVTLIHGDLGTYECVPTALHRRSIERTPYDRLQSVVFVIGLFHLKMAATDTIWQLLVSPDRARVDSTSFMSIAGKLRPNQSSRLVNGAGFQEQHDLIQHVGIVLRLDAWRTEIRRRTRRFHSLEEWVRSTPSLEEIQVIADCLACDYTEGEGLDIYELSTLSRGLSERDQLHENTLRIQNYLLLYEELSYAMNTGDIGRVEVLLAAWIPLFRAAGKHKYRNYTLRFMHALYFVYPERLRRAIRYNMLVNPTGVVTVGWRD
ncbi:hypothetical protein OH77DRAFT_1549155, partial [Trametes cingulata]